MMCDMQYGTVHTWHGIWDDREEADWEAQGAVTGVHWYGRYWVDERRPHVHREGIADSIHFVVFVIIGCTGVT